MPEHAALPELPEAVDIYDTTLRDGSQQEGLSLTVDDKLRVAAMVETNLATGGGTYAVALKDQAGTTLTEWKVVAADMPPKPFTAEATVPAGATSLHWEVVLAGQGPCSIGQRSILNLTTNAWLDL